MNSTRLAVPTSHVLQTALRSALHGVYTRTRGASIGRRVHRRIALMEFKL